MAPVPEEMSPRSACRFHTVQMRKAPQSETEAEIAAVLEASNVFCDEMMTSTVKRRLAKERGPYSLASAPRLEVFQNPLERYGYRAAAAAKAKDLPLLNPWSDRSRSKLGTPVTLEDLEKAARSQHPMPRRLAAKAREELRAKKAKSARDMAKRKALLPYLEGIQYTDQEVDRVKATIRTEAAAPDTFGRDRAPDAHERRTLATRSKERAARLAGEFAADARVPETTPDQDAALKRAMTPVENRATAQRIALLAEPTDTEILEDHAAKLLRRQRKRDAEAERIKTGNAPVGLSVKADCASVCGRFPWFGERMRLAEHGARAGDAPLPSNRGVAWLLRTLAECYDALFDANTKCGRDTSFAPKSKPPRPDAVRTHHQKKVRAPRVPDVVAADFWRRHGAAAPGVAYLLPVSTLTSQDTPEDERFREIFWSQTSGDL